MVELLELLRAKSEEKNPSLKEHIFESLERAKELKKFVEANGLEIKDSGKFFESLYIAVILHDLGKMNLRFQRDVYRGSEFPEELKTFLGKTKHVRVRHEILSAIWSCLLLPGNDEWMKKIRTAVLLHHYNEFYIGEKDLAEIVFNYMRDVKDYLEFMDKNWGEIEQILESLIEHLANVLKDDLIKESLEKISISKDRVLELKRLIEDKEDLIDFAEFYEIDNENPDYEFMVFLGCLRRCDYSASGGVEIEFLERGLKEIQSRIEAKIREKIESGLWQDDILKKPDTGSAVLIAPTGSGKTEFALLWGGKTGKKILYTLPLRVALNDLYKRFLEYAGDFRDTNVVSLLHSTAFTEYVAEEKQIGGAVDVEGRITSSKLLSAPVTLSTPDQIFLASLNYYGSDKVVSVFPHSAVILDEIQNYNPEMAAIILKTLKIIEDLGGNVLVMTATLPPYFEPFFECFDLNKFGLNDKQKKIVERFRLKNVKLVDTSEFKDIVKNYSVKRHRVKVWDKTLLSYSEDGEISVESDELSGLIDNILNSGKKSILVVVNNVSKAIALYEELKKNRDSVYLLHSRLVESVKSETIERINENLYNGKNVIVVSTQIIEASVDLDFDAMITEISPIDSQIQRWGRIWRNREGKNYQDESPNIYVFKIQNKSGSFDRGTRAVYSGDVNEILLNETLEVLAKYEGVLLDYELERKMIEEVFNKTVDGKTVAEMYLEKVIENLEFLDYFYVEKKSQAQRLFRDIAGFQVVVPKIMEQHGDELDRKLAKIVEKGEDLTWDRISEQTGISDKWVIKDRLYRFSINVPFYYFELLYSKNRLKNFKGYYVLTVDKDEAESIYEYGLDALMKKLRVGNEEDVISV